MSFLKLILFFLTISTPYLEVLPYSPLEGLAIHCINSRPLFRLGIEGRAQKARIVHMTNKFAELAMPHLSFVGFCEMPLGPSLYPARLA